jgi:regulatory protein
MEIYKLSDDIPESESGRLTKKHKYDRMGLDASEDARDLVGVLKITDIRQAVKKPNRVNVYVNGKYVFSLDVAQVVDLGVKVGRVLSDEELDECKKASEYGKEYQRALEWVLVRPRSVKELRDYLRRRKDLRAVKGRKDEWQKEREMAEAIARGEDKVAERMKKRMGRRPTGEKYDFDELIVERLCEKGYVDDGKFAEYYAENRFVKKGISRKRLRMELAQKGVDNTVIDEVVDGRSDEDEILKIIAKKRAKYNDEKLIAYLCRQGFGYQMAQNLVRTYEKD